MPSLTAPAKQQFFTNAGAIAAGYKLWTYAAGTTTPQATYVDRNGASANANPIILDSRGEAIIYADDGLAYDFQLQDTLGNVIWTRQGVVTSLWQIRSDLASTASGKGGALVGFLQNGTGAVVRTAQDKARERVSVQDFGAKGDGILLNNAVTIANGSTALTVAGASFATTDVGKAIAVRGAGIAGAPLFTTISAFVSATQVTLAAAASTALTASTQQVTYGTDDNAAFQSAINALPALGGTVVVPPAIYMIHAAAPTIGTKSVNWDISSGTVFDGALGGSTSLSAFPRANTNQTIVPFGPFAQVQTGNPIPGGNSLAAASALFEALQPSTFAGNSVGIYAGARSASPNGYLWAANLLAQADPGFGLTMQGIELDVNVFTTVAGALIKGLAISGIGTAIGSGGRKADVAIEIQHGVGWKRGIDVLNSDIGVQIRSTCATGISVNAPAGGTGAVLTGKQITNGSTAISIERNTDTAPTGYFSQFKTAAGAVVFQVAIDGVVTGAGFTTTGTVDTFNMALRYPAPTVTAGNIGLGNATGTTVGAAGGASAPPATPVGYWTINVGGSNYKIPYYN